MKMVKKILLGLAAGAVVIGLTSCADVAGAGKATGTKTNKTITVDGTDSKLETAYRRYIKQLGSSDKVAEIETTITIDEKDCILSLGTGDAMKCANVGFIFDMNNSWDDVNNEKVKDTNGNKPRDFVLFGFQPAKSRGYVEHYSNVNFKDELDTNDDAIGTSDNNIFGGGKWGTLTKGTHYTYEDGIYTLNVKVSQSPKGTYKFYLGGQYLGSYKSNGHYVGTNSDNANGFAIGEVAGYVNCPAGTKVKANYKTDSTSVTGKFEAEEIEE